MVKSIIQDPKRLLDNAWLDLHIEDESQLFNPLETIPDFISEEPHMFFTWLMSRPEYFHLFAKEILNIELHPMQCVILQELWKRKFPIYIASRGFGKSYLLAVYAIMRGFFMPGRKMVICGAGYRQSKIIFDYMCDIYNKAPILRDICSASRSGPQILIDMCRFHINGSQITALPIGDGQKIRGQRAQDIITDEFASINKEVFENVISGFGSVRSNPMEIVKQEAAKRMAKLLDLEEHLDIDEDDHLVKSNQIVFTGTAYYEFNHFCKYWKDWKRFIKSGGDKKKLAECFNDGVVPEAFDWRDYSIMRIPFNMIPKGFMDEGQIARSKATIHEGIFLMEFEACFSNDSNGFFKRSLVESCVASPDNNIQVNNETIAFTGATAGRPDRKYIYGIDPASQIDNFSIVIIELNKGHRRIVYTWTLNKQSHKEQLKARLVKQSDFYAYCIRKIRDLMKVFPCERMAIDSQGGGYTIIEGLHNHSHCEEGEMLIWESIDYTKPKDTDGEHGLHIIEKINIRDSQWNAEANHGMKKDFESKLLLFPYVDPVVLANAGGYDTLNDLQYDTLEDCMMEIESLKDELASIIHSETATGIEHWDTAEVKIAGDKKGKLRKDRYSALVMANGIARSLSGDKRFGKPEVGGWAAYQKIESRGEAFSGPSWFTDRMKDVY